MPGSSIPGFVARYGDALRRLNGPQPDAGALGTVLSGRIYDPSLSPNSAGLQQEAAGGLGALGGAPPLGSGALSPAPAPVGQADQIGALGTPPPAAKPDVQDQGQSYWDTVKDLSPAEKGKIAESFEKKGVNVEQQFATLQKSGQVDPGMIKTGPDGKVDKGDMALFLLESGLRTMQAAGQPGSTGVGAVATGALNTMDARRGRASATAGAQESQRRFDAEQAEKAAELEQRRAEMGSREKTSAAEQAAMDKRASEQNASAERMNRETNVSRQRAAKMAAGADKETFIDEETGMVFWRESQKPVMVPDGKGGQKQLTGKTTVDKSGVGDKDILTAVEKHRGTLDGDATARVTLPGEATPKRWATMSGDEKEAYLEDYTAKLRSRASTGTQTPKAAGKNVFDQFDE